MLITGWLAVAGPVDLWVGVPQEAGTAEDVVADGEGLTCTADTARLRCMASGPVSFVWQGDPAYALHGETTVQVGKVGTAWVLAKPGTRTELEATLTEIGAAEAADRHQIAALRRMTVYTSDHTPPWPTPRALALHRELLAHPDRKVRREALEGWHPWAAGTPYDPLPVAAPVPLDTQTLTALVRDPDPGVRRRMARLLRVARPAVDADFARGSLEVLLSDPHPGVRRATVVALPEAVDRGYFTALEAWDRVLAVVPQPRPAGRAACNQLGRLKARLNGAVPPETIALAMEQVLTHHPERGWSFWASWRDELPLKEAWIRRLVHDTNGLDPALVRHWHQTDPQTLERVLSAWQPTTFPERRTLIRRWAPPPR